MRRKVLVGVAVFSAQESWLRRGMAKLAEQRGAVKRAPHGDAIVPRGRRHENAFEAGFAGNSRVGHAVEGDAPR